MDNCKDAVKFKSHVLRGIHNGLLNGKTSC